MHVDLNFDKIRLVLKFLTKSLRRQNVFQDYYFNNALVGFSLQLVVSIYPFSTIVADVSSQLSTSQLCNMIVLTARLMVFYVTTLYHDRSDRALNGDTFWPPSQVAPYSTNDRVSLTYCFNFGNFLCTCQPS